MPSTKEVMYGSCFGCSHYDVCSFRDDTNNLKRTFDAAMKDFTLSVPYPFRIALICDKWKEGMEGITYC